MRGARRAAVALLIALVGLASNALPVYAAPIEWPATFLRADSGAASLAVDGGGYQHVAFVAHASPYGLWYGSNKTGSWSFAKVVSGAIGDAIVLKIDSAGKAHIARNAGGGALYYSTNRFGSWVDQPLPTPDAIYGTHMAMAIDPLGEVHIAVGGGGASNNGNINYITNRRGFWIGQSLGPGPGTPSIALDSNRRVHLSAERLYRTNASGSWVDEQVPFVGVPFRTSIVVTGDVVRIMALTPNGLEYGLRIGGNWTATNLGEATQMVHFVVDAAGKSHVAVPVVGGIDYVSNASGNWVRTPHVSAYSDLFGLAVSPTGRRYLLLRQTGSAWQTYLASSAPSPWTRTQVVGSLYDGLWVNQHPAIAVGPDGTERVAYVWPAGTGPGNAVGPGLRIATRTSGGWSTAKVTSTLDETPSLAIDANGKSHVAVSRPDAGADNAIWYGTDATGTWAWTKVDTAVDAACPTIKLGPDGDAVIAYQRRPAGSNQTIAVATNRTGSWVLATALPNSVLAGCPDVAVDVNNRGHVLYSNGTTQYYASDTVTLGAFSLRTSWPGTHVFALALDAAAKAHVAYTTATGLVRYRTNVTGVWVASDLGPSTAGFVTIVLGTSGPVIAWLEPGLFLAERPASAWVTTRLTAERVASVDLAVTPTGGIRVVYGEAEGVPGTAVHVFAR